MNYTEVYFRKNLHRLITLSLALGANLASIAFVFACKDVQFGDKEKGTPSSDKHQTGANRPTDESEGIVGYLTSPDRLQATGSASDGRTTVTGIRDAVAARGALPDAVDVGAWGVTKTDVDIAEAKAAFETLDIPATNLSCVKAMRDGSFTFSVRLPHTSQLIVTAGIKCTSRSIRLTKISSMLQAAIDDGSGRFRAFGFSPQTQNLDCLCAQGEEWDDLSRRCLSYTQGSGGSFSCEQGSPPVCGCNGVNYSNKCEAWHMGVKSYSPGACRG